MELFSVRLNLAGRFFRVRVDQPKVHLAEEFTLQALNSGSVAIIPQANVILHSHDDNIFYIDQPTVFRAAFGERHSP
jgi:hypothetical protein